MPQPLPADPRELGVRQHGVEPLQYQSAVPVSQTPRPIESSFRHTFTSTPLEVFKFGDFTSGVDPKFKNEIFVHPLYVNQGLPETQRHYQPRED